MRSPHEVLGIKDTATTEEIRAAYRKRAFDLHPDRAKGREAEWAELQQAYQKLVGKDDLRVSIESDQFVINLAPKVGTVLDEAVDAGAQYVTAKIGQLGADGFVNQVFRAVGRTVVDEGKQWLRSAISEGVKRATQAK